MKSLHKFLSVTLLAGACTATALAQAYKNPALSAEERAEDLLNRLTLAEKASLMENASPAITRLDIPPFNWWNEALHGVGRNGTATVFPITMGMASSFDDALLYEVFTAVSDEARAKNNLARKENRCKIYEGLSFWTPNINIFRDPRWGRGQETYGEDPYLTGRMGLAVVRGLQGPSGHRYQKLYACAKHFAVHSGPEWNRHSFNLEDLPPRDLWETYLPAFKVLVQEGDVKEVMCAYQRLDGEPCCGNTRLLQQILRNEWNFQGIVTSDCGAVDDFWKPNRHGFSPDKHSAISKAVLSGTDVECGHTYKSLPEAVKEGKITEEQINTSLKRLLKGRFELGDFDDDNHVEWRQIGPEVIACQAHHDLALKMAHESIVLLQNKNGILPLKSDMNIAVMGPNAADSTMLWGNYNGFPKHTTTMLEGIRQVVPQATYVRGCGLYDQIEEDAVQRVKDADVIIFVGGISPKLEGEEMKVNLKGFKGGDRTDIELPEVQRTLLAQLHKAGKKVIFVNCSGSAIGLEPETIHTEAIVQAWYGGECAGEALADILFGKVNPSGKLPITFYKNISQLPDYEDYRMQGRTYRYFKSTPLFDFGYGLSYTDFSLGKPRYQHEEINVRLKNTGKRAGAEVIQVYLRRHGDTDGPIKTLRAFKRVTLAAHSSQTVRIPLKRDSFEWWDTATNTMRVLPGTYDVMVGTSSRAEDLQTITVTIP